jgi:hypothetical protein
MIIVEVFRFPCVGERRASTITAIVVDNKLLFKNVEQILASASPRYDIEVKSA